MEGVFYFSILIFFSYLPYKFIARGSKVGNKNGWVRVKRKKTSML
jgi:hypothetical protein